MKLASILSFTGYLGYGEHRFGQLLVGKLVTCCLSLIFLSLSLVNAVAREDFNSYWEYTNRPVNANMYVTREMTPAQYPYLKGIVRESRPPGSNRYYELRVSYRNPRTGVWTTADRDDVNGNGINRTEGSSLTTCSGEQITGRKRDFYFGTWYFRTRSLPWGTASVFHFWFCPKKSYLDSLDLDKYLKTYLEVKFRYYSWPRYHTGEVEKKVNVTIRRHWGPSPDLIWSGGDGFLKNIVADGRDNYNDLYGSINNWLKKGPDHLISAVEEKWQSNGTSVGGSAANVEIIRDAIAHNNWAGLERPLGHNLRYGTWYFSDRYNLFFFRPNSEAINALIPGERVRSHVTYSWLDPACLSCTNGIIKTDTARVQITAPKPELQIEPAAPPVYEGESARFEILTTTNPKAPVVISYKPRNTTGNFLLNNTHDVTANATLSFEQNSGTGPYRALLSVPMRPGNNAKEAPGEISVELIAQNAYSVKLGFNVGSLIVHDADTPRLSIENAPGIEPGNTAIFKVTTPVDPKGAISVNYTPRDLTGDFLDKTDGDSGISRTANLTFARTGNSGVYSANISLATLSTTNDNGTIEVSIAEDTSTPKLYTLFDENSGTATVKISRTLLSISNISTPITEGETAIFTLTSNVKPTQPLNVGYIPRNDSGSFLDASGGDSGANRQITLSFEQSGSGFTDEIRIPTNTPNGLDDNHGQISVELLNGVGYSVTEQSSGTVTVHDSETPELSISAVSPVLTGNVAVFTITSNINPIPDLPVKILPENEEGVEFIDTTNSEFESGVQKTEVLNFTQNSETELFEAMINIPTKSPITNRTGAISVELVVDDSVPLAYNINSDSTQNLARVTMTSIVPLVTITTSTPTVNEGEAITIEVVSDIDPAKELDLIFVPKNFLGDFLDESAGNSGERRTVGLTFTARPDGKYQTEFQLNTRDPNGVDQHNGLIIVQLFASPSYRFDGSAVAIVSVTDTDIPELEIYDSPDIKPNEQAVFTVKTSMRPKNDLVVTYIPENSIGSYLDTSSADPNVSRESGENRTQKLSFSPARSSALSGTTTSYVATIAVPTIEDPNPSANSNPITGADGKLGEIAVRLVEDTKSPKSYTLASLSQFRQATVNLSTNNVPQLSIYGPDAPVIAGQPAIFTVRSNIEIPKTGLDIRYGAQNSKGSYLTNSPETTAAALTPTNTVNTSRALFELDSSGDYIATISVSTTDPSGVNEEDGEISVSLVSSIIGGASTYSVNPAQYTAVAVIRDNRIPELSIFGPDSPVIAGQIAIFTIRSSIEVPLTGLDIKYNVQNSIGSYLATIPESDGTESNGANLITLSKVLFEQDSNGAYSARIFVRTIDPIGIEEEQGEISVQLVKTSTGGTSTYSVNSAHGIAAAAIYDYNVPQLSIHAPESPVIEGESAIFKISSHMEIPTIGLDIQYAVQNSIGTFAAEKTESGEITPLSSSSITVSGALFKQDSAGAYTATITVPTLGPNGVDEEHGEISVQLMQSLATSSTYSVNPAHSIATASVHDYDTPKLTIAATESLNAGDYAIVTVNTDMNPKGPHQVKFIASSISGSFLNTNEFSPDMEFKRTLSFENLTSHFLIQTVVDPNSSGGEIVVEMLTDYNNPQNYIASNQSVRIEVKNWPEITINSNRLELTEGEMIAFTLSANPPPPVDIVIGLNITESNNIISFVAPRYVYIEKGVSSVSVSMLTVRDLGATNAGNVIVAISESEQSNRYYAGARTANPSVFIRNSVTFEIIDDVANISETETKYSVVSSVIRAILSSSSTPGSLQPSNLEKHKLPEISIVGVVNTIEEGAPLEFRITAAEPVRSDLYVDLKITETGGLLQNIASSSVKLNQNQVFTVYSIATIDDDKAELDGQVTVEISESSRYRVSKQKSATINVSDSKDRTLRREKIEAAVQTFYPELSNRLYDNTRKTISDRISTSFSSVGKSTFEYSGESSVKNILASLGKVVNDNTGNLQSVLGNTSFAINILPDEDAFRDVTIWGNGHQERMEFEANGNNPALDGDIFAGHFGLETKSATGILAGISAVFSESAIEHHSQSNENITFDSRTSGLYPYFGIFDPKDAYHLQTMMGYGLGTVLVNQSGYKTESLDSSNYSLAIYGSRKLFSTGDPISGGLSEITVDGEAWIFKQSVRGNGYSIDGTAMETRGLSIVAEGLLQTSLDTDSTLNPAFSIGTRWDGGDHIRGLGIELTGRTDYQNPNGLEISGEGQMLVSNIPSKGKKGLKGKIAYDSEHDGIGVFTILSPAWGTLSDSDIRQLRDDRILENSGSHAIGGARLVKEIGYGFSMVDRMAVLTPYLKAGLFEDHGNWVGTGISFIHDAGMSIEFEGIHKQQGNGDLDRKVRFQSRIEW